MGQGSQRLILACSALLLLASLLHGLGALASLAWPRTTGTLTTATSQHVMPATHHRGRVVMPDADFDLALARYGYRVDGRDHDARRLHFSAQAPRRTAIHYLPLAPGIAHADPLFPWLTLLLAPVLLLVPVVLFAPDRCWAGWVLRHRAEP